MTERILRKEIKFKKGLFGSYKYDFVKVDEIEKWMKELKEQGCKVEYTGRDLREIYLNLVARNGHYVDLFPFDRNKIDIKYYRIKNIKIIQNNESPAATIIFRNNRPESDDWGCLYLTELKITKAMWDEIKVDLSHHDDSACFIATAAYGTSMCNELDILRNFRDTYLINNTLGNLLVKTYYKVSPPIANFISHFNILRWVVRQFLKPIIFIIKRYNEWRR